MRLTKIAGLIVAGLALLLAAPVWAATEKGDTELGISGSQGTTTTSVSGSSTSITLTQVRVQVGYFLDKSSQLGGSVNQFQAKSEDVTVSETGFEAFYKFHFLLKEAPTIVPFVGAYLGSLQIKADFPGGSESGSGTSYAFAAGFKYFFSEHTSGNVEYKSTRSTVKIAGVSADVADNTVFFGISTYFSGKS